MKYATLILSAALTFSAALAQTAVQTATQSTDGTWTLTRLTDQQGSTAITGADAPTLSVQGEQISGSAGCNLFSTTGAVGGQTFRFAPIAATLRLCGPQQNALETRYLNVLAQARAFVLRGETLILTSGTSRAVFKMSGKIGGAAQQEMQTVQQNTVQSGLQGDWTLAGAQGQDPLTVTFGADGRVSGSTGCNTFMGDYKMMDAGLTFGPLGTTRRACPDQALAGQEQTFLKDLSEVTGYAVGGATLKLTTTAGKTLTLERQ